MVDNRIAYQRLEKEESVIVFSSVGGGYAAVALNILISVLFFCLYYYITQINLYLRLGFAAIGLYFAINGLILLYLYKFDIFYACLTDKRFFGSTYSIFFPKIHKFEFKHSHTGRIVRRHATTCTVYTREKKYKIRHIKKATEISSEFHEISLLRHIEHKKRKNNETTV